ncbi:GDSL-type esterase/lipase family protein [Tenuibacillus multivorans]|uniref:Lysophospholipase L1 n=1 Tax=Tenuibacillus multivorans TaxID=237069 RepID=A0A1G9WEP3_9BACI|nr:GDSL-type esterase/lipase family protein [Tenuibacillus multivorans]GEL76431.1 spore germination lipase LipC [Tenuibacillus multivorans]SDM83022.1 Lysophospholipase L1 [Tenuibacillus multivorans]
MNDLIIYKAIGDSLTVGIGNYLSKGYVNRYAQRTVEVLNHPVRTEVFAKNKLTSDDLLYLIQDDRVQSRLMTANIITITIGGNDLLRANKIFAKTYNPNVFNEASLQFYQNMMAILAEIQFLKSMYPTPYIIRLIGLYNPFPKLSYSDFWVQRFNDILLSFSDDHIAFVDIYPYFIYAGDHLLSFGGLHPNKYGYEVISEATVQTGYGPLERAIFKEKEY